MQGQGEQTDVFSAISAPARRAILSRLTQREMPVLELAETFQMTLSAVSQHLTVLRGAGLVTMRKAGRQRIYRLNPAPLREVAEWVSTYEKFWTDKFADLREYLEENP
jgi:DNA-binding transcriptional ArsR family regulator